MNKKLIAIMASVIVLPLVACKQQPANTSAGAGKTQQTPKAIVSQDVVVHFQTAKLPVTKSLQVTAESDPNHLLGRPHQYTSATYFADSRYPMGALEDELPHKVEVFATNEDAKKRADYIDSVTKEMPILAGYVLHKGRVVIMLDKIMVPDQVAEYQKALDQLPTG